jgi:prepilin-type N-terminal cleavage/methylation domain-containing protein
MGIFVTLFKYKQHHSGFTIVELLIVIVIIGILAAITIVAYKGIQDRARTAKMNSDLTELSKAVQLARISTSSVLKDITGSTYSASNCASKAAGTDLAALPQTDPCWVSYLNALNKISAASGTNVSQLVDPWGRPYFIDENEGESGNCNKDLLSVYAQPFNLSAKYPGVGVNIPLSGFSGCAT